MPDVESGSDVVRSAPTSPCLTGSTGDLYLDHAALLRRIAIRKFRVPPSDADALVHDVFINYLSVVRPVRTDVRAYLIGSICNASRNYWRSKRSEERVFADESSDGVVGEDIFEGLAANLAVASTLRRLGSRCREALRRYYLEGEDTPTIAAFLNTTPSNVNYLMHCCRKRAREVYQAMAAVGR